MVSKPGPDDGLSKRGILQMMVAAAALPLGGPALAAYRPALMSAPPKLRFGLNYVPSKNWWHIWSDWDAKAVAEDFRAIADLGMDHIRIMCLWPNFQPGINYISATAVDRLHQMLDLADRAELDVQVTVLNGWLSGFSYLPSWVSPLTDGPQANLFTSDAIVEAEKHLFQTLAKAIGTHRRFLGFDIGNEIDVLQRLSGLRNAATPAEADRWSSALLDYCAQIAPGRFHVNGVDDVPWFADRSFTRDHLASAGSATVLHCYAYWIGILKNFSYDSPESLHLLAYMVELANACAVDAVRPVWIEEVGASAEWMPENYLGTYLETLLGNALRCRNVWGVTWWCSHDIDPAMKGFASLEYTLGVLDQKNRVKPLGRELAKFVRNHRATQPSPLTRRTGLIIPDRMTARANGGRDFSALTKFAELAQERREAAIVLESRAEDEAYLKARGIKELIHLNKAI